MERWPKISIVTPTYNQDKYIYECIKSVKIQNYPNLEHIIIDGGSTDSTLKILGRFSHLKVISEPDRGQAEAINKGFRIATGDIFGFLNSDDTLLPGALSCVAKEIDSNRKRNIVMGRCRFVDESGRFIGIEHPSHYENHSRVLQIWKGHMIPQPSVFWTPKVWGSCGPMDETLDSSWVDFDLFCRFSKKYRFHYIDQILSNYRLHANSKTQAVTEAKRLEECIGISQRYWGTKWTLSYWRLFLSLIFYRLDRIGRALDLLRQARDKGKKRQFLKATMYTIFGGVIAPDVIFFKLVFPIVKKKTGGTVRRLLGYLSPARKVYPQTAACLNRSEPWEDGWVGPRLVILQKKPPFNKEVVLRGTAVLKQMSKPLILTVRIDGVEICQQHIDNSGEFEVKLALKNNDTSNSCTIEVEANTWFVPHDFSKNGDYRPLSWHLIGIESF